MEAPWGSLGGPVRPLGVLGRSGGVPGVAVSVTDRFVMYTRAY